MILFSWRTESCLRFPQSCHSLRWLEFQCYKNGDGHCSDSFSGLTSVRVFFKLGMGAAVLHGYRYFLNPAYFDVYLEVYSTFS